MIWYTLISERKEDLPVTKNGVTKTHPTASIGRISFWIVFAFMMFYWTYPVITGKPLEAPETLFWSFVALLSYNAFKKVPVKKIEIANEFIQNMESVATLFGGNKKHKKKTEETIKEGGE